MAQKIEIGPIDFEIARSAGRIYKSFINLGKHHHDDEELQIFPVLNRISLKLAEHVDHAKNEHKKLEALWAIIAPQLVNPVSIKDGAEFAATTREFTGLKRTHITFEEEDIFDLAQHLIGQRELVNIGHKMAERRSVAYPVKYKSETIIA